MARRKTKTSTGLQNLKAKVNVTISPESKSTLEKITSEMGLSKSALFEGILDGSICLSSQNAQQVIHLSSSSEKQALDVSISDEVKSETSVATDTGELQAQTEKISALEKQLQEQESEISQTNNLNKSLQEQLDAQLAIVSNLKSKLEGTSSAEHSAEHQELIDLINHKEEKIKQLNQEINRLKAEVEQSKSKEVVSASKANESDLKYLSQRQQDTIARLEARIAELQTVASIGNQTLNKWRSKVYH